MSTADSPTPLKTAIAHLKAGNRAAARELLMQLVAQDEANEQAWLWLSAAADSREDQIVCLENVLTLNPDNELAQKRLNKISPSVAPRQTVRREHQPISPASAILYPERQVKEWEWHDPTTTVQAAEVSYQSQTAYDDVWTQDVDLCPYCATAVNEEDAQCPSCKRPLLVKSFRYEKPSSHLHILWVLLLGMANIQFLQFIFNIVYWQDILGALLNILLIVIFFVLAVGTYARKFWAFLGAQIACFAIIAITLVRWFYPLQITSERFANFDPSITRFINGLGDGFGNVINVMAASAAFLAFLYAALLVAPDFEQLTRRRLATVQKGLSAGSDFHIQARRAAQAGMWATAVLHWQRAAANEPGNLSYQQHLGEAYGRLGFYQRSLDVLKSMYNQVTNPERKREVEQLISTIKQQQAAQTAVAAEIRPS